MLHKCCFWVRHTFGNYLWKFYFPKNYCVVTNIYIYIYIYENTSYLVLYLIFDMEIMDFMVYYKI